MKSKKDWGKSAQGMSTPKHYIHRILCHEKFECENSIICGVHHTIGIFSHFLLCDFQFLDFYGVSWFGKKFLHFWIFDTSAFFQVVNFAGQTMIEVKGSRRFLIEGGQSKHFVKKSCLLLLTKADRVDVRQYPYCVQKERGGGR
jgi:hypothetical protein